MARYLELTDEDAAAVEAWQAQARETAEARDPEQPSCYGTIARARFVEPGVCGRCKVSLVLRPVCENATPHTADDCNVESDAVVLDDEAAEAVRAWQAADPEGAQTLNELMPLLLVTRARTEAEVRREALEDMLPVLRAVKRDAAIALRNKHLGHDWHEGDIELWDALPADVREMVEVSDAEV